MMKYRNLPIVAKSVLAILVIVIVAQAQYVDASIAKTPTRTVAIKEKTNVVFLYKQSGCSKTYGFSEDRFEYEAMKLNGRPVDNAYPGEAYILPWND